MDISDVVENHDTGSVEVTAHIQLNLPFRWKGVSPNGIREIEPVILSFASSYPIHAPEVKLRADFDRSLAHIQPASSKEESVVPCLYDGDIDELFHADREGLLVIVDQLVIWLEKAAVNQLIDSSQGWEPIRRDTFRDIIVADSSFLRSLVSRKENHNFLRFRYRKRTCSTKTDRYPTYGKIDNTSVRLDPWGGEPIFQEWGCLQDCSDGKSVALVVTPGKTPSGGLHTATSYRPENVTNLSELRERATEYGCIRRLDKALARLRDVVSSQCKVRKYKYPSDRKFPLAVVLCVRRPFPLIGEASDIELVPYIVDVGLPKLLTQGGKTPVFPASHRHAITPTLLQNFSGEAPLPNDRNIVLLGCGSLGSKIAMHMARSGTAPSTVIDKRLLSPHNFARHALLPKNETMLEFKAQALVSAIADLGQSSTPLDEDVTKIAQSPELLKTFIPARSWATINATASLTVRETLASLAPEQLPARIIETSLFSSGTVGLMTVEGPERNPNSSDLIAEAYEAVRKDSKMRAAIFEGDEPMRRRDIGQGCGSTTMAISDAKISLFAASMTQGITTMHHDGLPDEGGRIFLGIATEDGMGLSWTLVDVPPVQVVQTERNSGWTVRISDRAHQKIVEESTCYSQVETGGILVGRISKVLQAFLITDVISAPTDSTRSRSEFTLGTCNVESILQEYTASCRHALYCLGTWHSHLNESGSSERDLQTAATIADGRLEPSVLLIRTPTTYWAILAMKS